MDKFDKAVTFEEAFKLSELSGLPEFFCEVSFLLPRVPGHLLLGACDICDQDLDGKPHVCFGQVKHDDFEFDNFDFDEEDDDDED
jgi:hypothetical protein